MATTPEFYGANPVNYQWTIVRGDTAVLRIEFVENDEETAFDTSAWDYAATVYDSKGNQLDDLDVTPGTGYVEITARPDITESWGTGFRGVVAELAFDLEVTFEDVVWTPVIGTIKVLADVTGGSL